MYAHTLSNGNGGSLSSNRPKLWQYTGGSMSVLAARIWPSWSEEGRKEVMEEGRKEGRGKGAREKLQEMLEIHSSPRNLQSTQLKKKCLEECCEPPGIT